MRDWRAEVRARLGGLALAPTRAEEIVEELAQHLEDRYRELLGDGVAEPEARRAALEELAKGPRLAEELRRAERPADPAPVLGTPSGGGWWRGIADDVRFGLRALRKSPGLSTVALLTLALGIGANAAIFSVVNAALLRPLPFAAPDRLVAFWGSAPEMGLPLFAYPDALYVYYRTRSRTLEDVSAYSTFSMTLTGRGEPERLSGTSVTADFFRLLGRMPQVGRAFLPEEEARGKNQVAVLSHGLWQRRFGGDPGILEEAITLDGTPFTVVGIMPPGFDFPDRSELWIPLATDPQNLDCWCHPTLGRLRPGKSPEDAAREIAGLSDDFWREREGKPPRDPDSKEASKAVVIAKKLAQSLVGEVRTPLLVLLGAVGVLLLIACANIANLLLARASVRGREIAVRCCLGASPWRIVRQLLVESLILALAGAALGLGLAFWAVRALGVLAVERLRHLHAVSLDPTVLLFTFGIALATVVLFGLAPALRGARVDLHDAVRDGARGTRGGRSRRLSDAFVVAQLALSLVLLVGAGLLLRSFRNLLEVDLGFRPDHVLVGRVAQPIEAFERQPARSQEFFTTLEERVAGLPGVRSVGLSSTAPFSDGGNAQVFTIRGREPAPGQPNLVAQIRVVTPGYFATVGTPLVRGRYLDQTDVGKAPRAALVDETLARRFWADGNAIGRQIRLGDAAENPWLTIVGVVRSIKHNSVVESPERYVYLPLLQRPLPSMDVVARTSGDPAALTVLMRRELKALDPTLPLYGVHSLEGAVARSLGTERLTNHLLLAFAATALLLAAIGIYGVMALGVSQRVNEFGIRLALGASPGRVLAVVLGHGVKLLGFGVILGLGGAFAMTRLLGSLLFEVRPNDPLTFGAVLLLLVSVALTASFIPARRATTTDPLVALRSE